MTAGSPLQSPALAALGLDLESTLNEEPRFLLDVCFLGALHSELVEHLGRYDRRDPPLVVGVEHQQSVDKHQVRTRPHAPNHELCGSHRHDRHAGQILEAAQRVPQGPGHGLHLPLRDGALRGRRVPLSLTIEHDGVG